MSSFRNKLHLKPLDARTNYKKNANVYNQTTLFDLLSNTCKIQTLRIKALHGFAGCLSTSDNMKAQNDVQST